MRCAEVEHWVITVRIGSEQARLSRDSRVELKAEWPDAVDAARRIAGHANAARGDPVLWIIGLDEKRGAIGAAVNELAKWHPRSRRNSMASRPPWKTF